MRNLKGRALALMLAFALAVGLVGSLPASALAEGLSLSDLLKQMNEDQAGEVPAEEGQSDEGPAVEAPADEGRSGELPAMMYQAPTQEMLDAAAYTVQSQIFDGEGEFPSGDAFGCVQGSDISRTTIQSVRFEDSLAGAPEDAWDVSAAGDGSVLAWVELNGNLYDMTIAGEGGVALNEPMGMFCNYINLQTVDFNGCVDTSAATDMSLMFYGCMLVKELDLRELDTSNVTNMSDMFGLCIMLLRLNLESFDTASVEDMGEMFYGTFCLNEIEIGPGFVIGEDTRVDDMFGMSVFTMEKLQDAIDGHASAGASAESNADSKAENSAVGESILMSDACGNDVLIFGETAYALGSDIPRASVRSIRFVSSMDGAPEDAWDVSQAGDGSVLAWVEPNGELYDLTIAGSGRIRLSNGCTQFARYSALEELDFNGCVDTSAVADMSDMFEYCHSLVSLDLSGFDTSSASSMKSMFNGCEALTSLNLSGFDTANVTDMGWMFSDCAALQSLDLSGFDTANVSDMTNMFQGCASLASLEIGGFNTASVSGMASMFEGCANLESLDVSGFDTANIADMSNMFSGCASLTSLDTSGFDTASATDMHSMFNGCASLESLVVSGFDTSNVTDMSSMFSGCARLEELDLSNFDTHSVTNMREMLRELTGLQKLRLSFGFAIGQDTIATGMLDQSPLTMKDLMGTISGDSGDAGENTLMVDAYEDDEFNDGHKFYVLGSEITRESVRSIRFVSSMDGAPEDAWDVSRAGDGSVLAWVEPNGEKYDLTIAANGKIRLSSGRALFARYRSLEELDFNGCVDSSAVANMHGMFLRCDDLTSLDLSGLDTSNVTDMASMFNDCTGLESLDLSGLDTSNVTDMCSMFYNCEGLKSLELGGFNTASVTNMSGMFNFCKGLESLDLSGFDTANVTDMSAMFWGCEGLSSLNVSGFDTANVTDMIAMFSGCASLASLDVSGFDTSNVTDMGGTFSGCASLASLDVSGFDTANVVNMTNMFNGCAGLKSLDLSGFDTANVLSMAWMFGGCTNLASLNVSGFDTHSVTSMEGMFSEMTNLDDLFIGPDFVIGEDTDTEGILDKSPYTLDDLMDAINGPVSEYPDEETSSTGASIEMAGASIEMAGASNEGSFALVELVGGPASADSVEETSPMSASIEMVGGSDGEGHTSGGEEPSEAGASNDGSSAVLELVGGAGEDSDAANGAPGESILMADEYADDELYSGITFYVLGSDIPRSRVRSVRFVDSMDGAPQDAWDVSQAGDGSVLAWAEPNDKQYDLTIAGNGKVALSSGRMLFASYDFLEKIDFNGCVDTSAVTDMHGMFWLCSLWSLDLSGFDTSNVTDMHSMFSNCQLLKSLDVSSFDTANVTDMSDMFSWMLRLQELRIGPGFVIGENTNVENIMFLNTYSPEQLNDAINAAGAENGAVDVGNTAAGANVLMADEYDAQELYPAYTYALGSDIYRNSVRSVRFVDSMDGAPEDAWDVSQAGDGSVLAWAVPNGSRYDLTIAANGRIRLSSGRGLFGYYTLLEEIDFNGCVDTSAVTDMHDMFKNCRFLASLDVSGFDTANVTDMSGMFSGCNRLKKLVLNSFDTRNVKDMREMFSGLTGMQELDFGVGFAIGEDTNVEGILDRSPLSMDDLRAGLNDIATEEASLPESEKGNSTTHLISFPDIPGIFGPIDLRFPEENTLQYFSTSGTRDVFGNHDCDRSQIRSVRFEDSLESVPEGAWDVSQDSTGAALAWLAPNGELYDLTIAAEGGVRMNEESAYLFQSYDHLESVSFNNNVYMCDVRDMAGMFQGCTRLKELVFFDGAPGSNMSAANVEDLLKMFEGCESLTEVDLSWLMTDRVYRFDNMFQGCSKLERIQVDCGFVVLTEYSSEDGEIYEAYVNDVFDGCNATILWRDDGVEANMRCGDWLRMISIRPGTNLEDGGDAVKWAQRMLISKGLLPKGSDDGIFGDKTREAWRRFQDQWYLDVDNVSGPNILSEVRIHNLVKYPFEDITIPPEPDIPDTPDLPPAEGWE